MTLRERAAVLRDELRALGVALGDPRTPWYAKAIAGLTLGLAVSPVDPIPDFVPVVGYLDDLVFVPLGVYLARRTVPDEVLADAREVAAEGVETPARRLLGAVLVVLLWSLGAAAVAWAAVRWGGLAG